MTNNNRISFLLQKNELFNSKKCLHIFELLLEMVELILECHMLIWILNRFFMETDTCLFKSYSK